jgi:hypothetical protein
MESLLKTHVPKKNGYGVMIGTHESQNHEIAKKKTQLKKNVPRTKDRAQLSNGTTNIRPHHIGSRPRGPRT